jgi:hypothetical protein
VTATALVGQQVASKATRDALFLSTFDVRTLPWAMAASAVLSLLAVLAYARAVTRFSPLRVMPWALLISSGLLAGVWLLGSVRPRWAAAAVYLYVAVFGATLVSGFWALLAESFDPRSARRLMGPVVTGANVGAVLGGVAAFIASRVLEVPAILPGLAVLHLACFWGLRSAGLARDEAVGDGEGDEAPSPAGLRVLKETPYLRQLACVVLLVAFVQALLDYVLGAGAAARFGSGPALMSFFALFHTAVSVGGLAVQAAAGRPALDRLGLAGTVALHPAAVAVSAVAALVSPRLWSAVLLRGVEGVLRNSLFRSGYELFYTPLPPQKTRPTKAIVDVGFDRLGTIAGSLAVLAVLAVVAHPRPALLALSAAAALGALALLPALRRGYVGALAESLRTGSVHLEAEQAKDATTRWTLAGTRMALDRQTLLREIEAMRISSAATAGEAAEPAPLAISVGTSPLAGDPLLAAIEDLRSGTDRRVRRVLDAPVEPLLLPWVLPLLAREHHFADALRYLRACASRATGQLVDALLDAQQPLVVRRRVARVLRGVPEPRAVEGLLTGLEDATFEVRAQCALALLRLVEQHPDLRPPVERAFEAVLRELERTDGGERELEHVFALLALALEREPVQLALRALKGSNDELRGTALEYLENVLPDALRQRLGPLLGEGPLPAPSRPKAEVRDELLRSRVVPRSAVDLASGGRPS